MALSPTPMVERGLRRSFEAVPVKIVRTYDWHSPEGQRFLEHVDTALQAGVSLERIGDLLGISNFPHRYNAMRRGENTLRRIFR